MFLHLGLLNIMRFLWPLFSILSVLDASSMYHSGPGAHVGNSVQDNWSREVRNEIWRQAVKLKKDLPSKTAVDTVVCGKSMPR